MWLWVMDITAPKEITKLSVLGKPRVSEEANIMMAG